MHYTLGADPELIIGNEQNIVPASKFFVFDGIVGRDGCSTLVELRPPAAHSPSELISTIANLILLTSKLTKCNIYAGHYQGGYPIGGHLHYGGDFGGKKLSDIVLSLDACMSSLSYFVDDQAQKNVRVITSSYGKLNNIEQKSWGFEYRYPCSWLLCPEIAFAYVTFGAFAVYQSEYVVSTLIPFLKSGGPEMLITQFAHTPPELLVKNISNDQTVRDILTLSSCILKIIGTGWNWNVDITPFWGKLLGEKQ